MMDPSPPRVSQETTKNAAIEATRAIAVALTPAGKVNTFRYASV